MYGYNIFTLKNVLIWCRREDQYVTSSSWTPYPVSTYTYDHTRIDTHWWLPLQFYVLLLRWTRTVSETCRVIINQVKQKLHLVGYLLTRYWIQDLLLKLVIKELNFKNCCSWMHLFEYSPFKDKPLSEQRNQLIPLRCMAQQSNMCHLQNPSKIDLVFKVLFKFKRRKNNSWANVIFSK